MLLCVDEPQERVEPYLGRHLRDRGKSFLYIHKTPSPKVSYYMIIYFLYLARIKFEDILGVLLGPVTPSMVHNST